MNMARYVEAMTAHHDANPQDAEARAHEHLDSLGLSGAAKQHIISEQMAAVAAHLSRNPDVLKGISRLDDESQVKELTKIHEQERRGATSETADSNRETDEYLAGRESRGRLRR
ncbi:MAG: hypothetical protein ACHQIK_17165 [Candidatus Acidiferrales bacterium]